MRYLYVLLPVLVTGCGSTFSVEVSSAAVSCLVIVPPTCPDCMTENPSDQPACERSLTCFRVNQCNPADACGQASGICGVNTLGGGSAPLLAATATYECACSASADP
jgi:hypothetical protein